MFHIPYLDTNPIAQAEYRRLRHTNDLSRGHKVVFALVYLLIVLVAFSPYVYYITPGRVGWLAVMAIVVFGFQIYVTLRTAAVITSVPLPQTELLTITPMSRWRLVVGKWWGAFRVVWAWHLLTAIPKVGLSLGVMNYMHTMSLYTWSSSYSFVQRLMSPFVYFSYSHIRSYPELWLIMPVLGISLLLSMVTALTLVATGIFVVGRHYNLRFIRLLALHSGVVAVVTLIAGGHIMMHDSWANQKYREWSDQNCPQGPQSNCDYTTFGEMRRHVRGMRRASEFHAVALLTSFDDGVMINANIMSQKLLSMPHATRCFWLGYCDGVMPRGGETDAEFQQRVHITRLNHLLYLLRHMASAAYGMFLHVLLTLGLLWLAARRHP